MRSFLRGHYGVVAASAARPESVITDRRTYCWLGGTRPADLIFIKPEILQMPHCRVLLAPRLVVFAPNEIFTEAVGYRHSENSELFLGQHYSRLHDPSDAP